MIVDHAAQVTEGRWTRLASDTEEPFRYARRTVLLVQPDVARSLIREFGHKFGDEALVPVDHQLRRIARLNRLTRPASEVGRYIRRSKERRDRPRKFCNVLRLDKDAISAAFNEIRAS